MKLQSFKDIIAQKILSALWTTFARTWYSLYCVTKGGTHKSLLIFLLLTINACLIEVEQKKILLMALKDTFIAINISFIDY